MNADTPAASAVDDPLVSILVPAYQAAPFLREALDSILAQTYRNIEVLVLDDASTDDTPAIMKEYEGRVQYIRQPKNMGIYDNVNVGIAQAKGEFITTYHSDDVYLPAIVERQVRYLQAHPKVGAVFCADIFIDAKGREYHRLRLPEEVRGNIPLDYRRVLNALMRYKNAFLVCPTAMVRASVHADVGVYRQDRYKNTSDLEMWLRIARSYPIAVLEEHLMKYRHFHGNSSSRYHHLRTAEENYFRIMDEYLNDGGRALAAPDALIAYEAHRSHDRLMAAISHYIKGEMSGGLEAIANVQVDKIARTERVQRWRLLLLTAGMHTALRLPRNEWLAQRMLERWHVKRSPTA